MMRDANAFVDTNVLLRAILTQMDDHAPSDTLVKRLWREGVTLWISGQVIREFIVQATHPKTLKIPLSMADVIATVDAITPLFQVADETPAVRAELLRLLREFPTGGKQVHDANLVATMLVYGIDTLLTINVDDLKRFGGIVTIVSPMDNPS